MEKTQKNGKFKNPKKKKQNISDGAKERGRGIGYGREMGRGG